MSTDVPVDRIVDVLVVGAGPTGLTVANLLAARGVDTLVVEAHRSTSNEAKAISIDDESLRVLTQAGCLPAVAPIVVPGVGTSYYGRHGQLLAHARGIPRFGHPFKNPFAQPELERALVDTLVRAPSAQLNFHTQFETVHQHGDHVRAELTTADGPRTVRARYLLGCDGGRSAVRAQLGIRMLGSNIDDPWLVVDTLEDPHDERYGMHHGEPARPFVIVPGRGGRCRYEFRVGHDEAEPGERVDFDLVRRLLAPHRTITPAQVERAAVYTFHALVAQAWRRQRCFLLGDAAHMMPPFAGQGLNSGIRDAANLAWKLHRALTRPTADTEALFDTYEAERRPHAEATVRFSVRLGRIVMTRSRAVAACRDQAVRIASATPHGRRYLREMRFRPRLRLRSALVDTGTGSDLVGTALPQPLCLSSHATGPTGLDDALGDAYALLAVDPARCGHPAVARAVQMLDAVPLDVLLGERLPADRGDVAVVSDADGGLRSALGDAAGRCILVRPDRVIAAVFDPPDAVAVAESFLPLVAGAASTPTPRPQPEQLTR